MANGHTISRNLTQREIVLKARSIDNRYPLVRRVGGYLYAISHHCQNGIDSRIDSQQSCPQA